MSRRDNHRTADRFVEQLAEPLRSAVHAALTLVPDHRVPRVKLDSDSPWLTIAQTPGPPLALWIESGDVYEIIELGAVSDEPVLKRTRADCSACGGNGGDFDDSSKPCDECGGAGKLWAWVRPEG